MVSSPAKPQTVTMYEKAFRAGLSEIPGLTQVDWVEPLRQQGLSRFEALGFPTRKWEAWKYFNLRPVLNEQFMPISESRRSVLRETVAEPSIHPFYVFPDESVYRLVFVNGVYEPQWSTQGVSRDGLTVLPLSHALETQAEKVKQHIHSSLEEELNPFVAINTAHLLEGVYLHVSRGNILDKPVEILWVSTGDDEAPRATYPRFIMNLEEDTQATVVTQFAGVHPGFHTSPHYLTNGVIDLAVASRANLDHTVIFREGRSGTTMLSAQGQVHEDAQVQWFTAALDGSLIRNNVNLELVASGSTVSVMGLNVLNRESQFHAHTHLDHQKPYCRSEQLFKGILDGQSRSEFDGVVRVRPGAVGTDAKQLNKNLLLSPQAQVFTRPWLWIDTDDVSCAHGATVGQLDPEEMFYLASRGLSPEVSQCMLTFGFAEDLITRIPHHTVRRYLERRVLETLGQSSNPNDCWMSCEWKKSLI